VEPWLAVVMSLVAFSGSAQFAFVTAMSGGLAPAIGAASLINLRYIPMSASIAGALKGGVLRRSVEAQAVVDGSWAAAHRPDGTIDRELMIAATLAQWPAWVLGTALGALLLPSTSTVHAMGLDAVFPVFFGLLLLDVLRAQPSLRRLSTASACCTALALLVVPVGVAMMVGCIPSILAARRPAGSR
jgi:predicted branched-subunit amino acid permease